MTRFASVKAPGQWIDETTTWGAFVASLDEVPAYLAKEHAPLHALYRLRRGGRRCNADVERVYGVCLDFDGVPVEHVLSTVERLQADGIAVLWHTTWKHGRELDPENKDDAEVIARWGIRIDERRRLIIPLAEPIPGTQYDALLGMIWGRYAEHSDRESGGVHRAFYVPSRHPERESELHYLPGAGLRFSALTPPLAPVPEQRVHALSIDTWQRLAARWTRSSKPSDLDLGARLKRILEGVSYADHGERDTVTWRLVQAIAHAYPEISPDAVRELFSLSVDRMRGDGSTLTLDEIVEKLERARRGVLAAQDTLLPDDRRAAIRQAFGSSRDTPYTDDELDTIASHVGLDRATLDRSWILHRGAEYWLIGPDGKLVQACRDSLENTARVVLAPTPVELHEIGKLGRQWMPRKRLLELYSLPLDDLSRSLVIDEPRFELPARRLTMPACPRRDIAPRFDPEIDQWLHLLAGDRYELLLAWLQWVPALDRPCAALVITGPKSVGKSLLAQGISRLWCETGPTDLADAMGAWNQAIERCPYCFADEGRIPKDQRGHERTEDLREFIQCTRRVVNQKYRQPMALEGATRTQIAANNLDLLTLGGNLSGHDVDAIAARFVHVAGQPEAAAFLEARGGREGAAPWVEGDGLAAHVLWWYERQAFPWIGRFGVPPQPELVDRMLVRGGTRAAICELIVRALKDQQPLRPTAIVAGAEFACKLDWITETWDVYLRQRKPETPFLLQALDGLGEQGEVDGEGWFLVRTSRLQAWAREAGVGSPGRVHEWLVQHERDRR